MAKADVLARVQRDLANGHTDTALARLRTLLAVEPDDLDIYRMLAQVYRRTGNLVEAGRWAFLTDDLPPAEQAAFERAHPDPWLRARLIQWTGDPAELPDTGRDRLHRLRAAAEQSGPPARWSGHPAPSAPRATVPCLFVALTLLAAAALAAVGVFQAIDLFLR